jgi:hypothetical protein
MIDNLTVHSSFASLRAVPQFELLLGATSVVSVSLWLVLAENNHHRGTETTEVAPRNPNQSLLTSGLPISLFHHGAVAAAGKAEAVVNVSLSSDPRAA